MEDHVLGRVTAEQFRMLSSDYNGEQKQLDEAIPEKEARLEKLRASAANVDSFIEKAKRYTVIDELTPELLRLFIQRIEVGERSKKYSRSGIRTLESWSRRLRVPRDVYQLYKVAQALGCHIEDLIEPELAEAAKDPAP